MSKIPTAKIKIKASKKNTLQTIFVNYLGKVKGFLKFVIGKKNIVKAVTILGIILLSFFAGMGFQSMLERLPDGGNSKNGSSGSANTTKEVIRGDIGEIKLPQVKIETVSDGQKTLIVNGESVILNNKSQKLKAEDLKEGNNVLIYASKNSKGELIIDRLRVVE